MNLDALDPSQCSKCGLYDGQTCSRSDCDRPRALTAMSKLEVPVTQWVSTARDDFPPLVVKQGRSKTVYIFHKEYGEGIGYWKPDNVIGSPIWISQYMGRLELGSIPDFWRYLPELPKC